MSSPTTTYRAPNYTSLLLQLDRMLEAAIRSGLRYRGGRGGEWKWSILPVEYLMLTQQVYAAHVPDVVRDAAREICK